MKSARWKKTPRRAQTSAGSGHDEIPPEDPSSLHGQIIAKYGPPFRLTDKDEIKDINQNYYAARFVREHKLVFDRRKDASTLTMRIAGIGSAAHKTTSRGMCAKTGSRSART